MAKLTPKTLVWIALAMTASAAFAGDRHVYLDTNGDGTLNDCPNPAHNAKGASNTDELSWCQGGSANGRIVGTASGRTSTDACTAGGGAVKPVVNGTQADVDGDGAAEPIYGHPQACVYNMAKSDSCEVHAGTYRQAGADCAENCGDDSVGGGSYQNCDGYDCFFASVVAFGYGPNQTGAGYGTASAPGYLRGAVMNGSTDSWDPNGDKDPSDGAYPAILSGDRDNDGVFDTTTCSGGACGGDAFHMVMVGCGGTGSGSYGSILCSTALSASEHGVKVDTNADGVFDTEIGSSGPRSVDHFVIRDLEFKRYNGGNGNPNDGSARFDDGSITLNADGSGDGLKLDHIYMHDNDYTVALGETLWGHVADHRNSGCADWTEIKNSYLVQNNEKFLVSDWQVNDDGGCAFNIHDNRVVVDVTSSRARTDNVVFAYLKPINKVGGGTRAKQHRIWNNEFIYMNPKNAFLLDVQGFGDSGQLWIYGNLFRGASSMSGGLSAVFSGFCGTGTGTYAFYFFNNTFDFDEPINKVCGANGGMVVEKNNVFLRPTYLYMCTAATVKRSNNKDSLLQADRARWFTNASGALPGVHAGLASYAAKVAGALDNAGICDPDGDGAAGVDYDWNGVNDTSWRDIAGRTVSCPSAAAFMDLGAIQSLPDQSDTTPPSNVSNTQRTDKK